MYNPIIIANYFISKSFETGKLLTPMKLLKLVYIAHGWHLGITEEPLINEITEAWKFGPVVPSVYYEFKKYGNNPINALSINKIPLIDSQTVKLLDKVFSAYEKHDGLQLSTITHKKGSPWEITWNERGGRNNTSVPISNNLIQKYYSEKVATNKSLANGG